MAYCEWVFRWKSETQLIIGDILKILIIGGSSIVGFKMLKFLIEKKINVEYTYYSNNINIENGHVTNLVNVTTEIIRICMESEELNHRKNKGLNKK